MEPKYLHAMTGGGERGCHSVFVAELSVCGIVGGGVSSGSRLFQPHYDRLIIASTFARRTDRFHATQLFISLKKAHERDCRHRAT